MRREVHAVDGDTPMSKVIGIFREHRVPLVLVRDVRSGKILGAITQRIAIRGVYDPETTKARTMAVKLPQIDIDESVSEAARLMLENNVNVLPVREGDEIVGSVTAEDLFRAVGERFFSKYKVRDIMSRDLTTVTPDSTIGRAIVLMRESGVSRLPVVESDKLVGVVTINDVLVKVIQPRERATRGEYAGEKLRTLSHQVRDIMTADVVIASPNEPLDRALKRMIDNDVSCLIVVQDGRPVGIITRSDVLEPLAALSEREKPAISVQLSFKVRDLSSSDKEQVMDVVRRYLERLGESFGTGYLTLYFKEHRERRGGSHLIHCRARLNTDKVHLVGVGESWTLALAAKMALDVIERKFLVMKENMQKYPYAEELLTAMASEV